MIDQLLQDWAGLEPNRCQATKYPNSYLIRSAKWGCYHVDIQPSMPDLMRLHALVQDAIAARPDWHLILELTRHPSDGSPQYFAMLYRPRDVEPFTSLPCHEAAIALLEAYTQALKAEQQQAEAIATGGDIQCS